MNLLEQQLVELGFTKPNRDKLELSYKYHLGRGRFISAMCLGTATNLCGCAVKKTKIV